MGSSEIMISIDPAVSIAVANKNASELIGIILASCPDVHVRRAKNDPTTQDLGATIGIVIGSAAVTAVAKGMADWMRKRSTARLVLSKDKIIIENVTPSTIESILRRLTESVAQNG
jgi:hypothetical protein